MVKYLSIFILTLSLCSVAVICTDYTDAVAYNNCFESYEDGTLCNDRLIACQASTQCTAAVDWDWNVCSPNCATNNYTYLSNSLEVEKVSCSKNCDQTTYDHNFTDTSAKTIFKNAVDCYSVCYHFLAGFRLESIFTTIILLLLLVFKLN